MKDVLLISLSEKDSYERDKMMAHYLYERLSCRISYNVFYSIFSSIWKPQEVEVMTEEEVEKLLVRIINEIIKPYSKVFTAYIDIFNEDDEGKIDEFVVEYFVMFLRVAITTIYLEDFVPRIDPAELRIHSKFYDIVIVDNFNIFMKQVISIVISGTMIKERFFSCDKKLSVDKTSFLLEVRDTLSPMYKNIICYGSNPDYIVEVSTDIGLPVTERLS